MVSKKPDAKGGSKDKKKLDKTKVVMKKVTSGGGSKAKKKKWSKGKVREKLDNQTFLDEASYAKALKEIPKMTMITPSIISEKYKLKLSVARQLLRQLIEQKLISVVIKSSHIIVCSKPVNIEPVSS